MVRARNIIVGLLAMGFLACGDGPKRPTAATASNPSHAPSSKRTRRVSAQSPKVDISDAGRLFVRAKTLYQVALTHESGTIRHHRTNHTFCGLAPGNWQIKAESKAFLAIEKSITIKAGETRIIDLESSPRAALQLTGSGRVSLVDSAGQRHHLTLPYTHKHLPPGLSVLVWKGTNSLVDRRYLRLHQGKKTVAVGRGKSGHRIYVNNDAFATRASLPVTSFNSEGGLSYYRRRAARKLVRRRIFDREGVQNLDQLQWKIRSIIIHSGPAGSARARMTELVRAKKARHFIIDSTGTVYQTADLVEVATSVDKWLDRTAIHIELVQLPPSADKPGRKAAPGVQRNPITSIQQDRLAHLLALLHALFPRVQAHIPRNQDKTVRQEPLIYPRTFKGIMTQWQVSREQPPARFKLNWKHILTLVRGEAIALAPKPSKTEAIRSLTLDIQGDTESVHLVHNGVALPKTSSPFIACNATGTYEVRSKDTNALHFGVKVDGKVREV